MAIKSFSENKEKGLKLTKKGWLFIKPSGFVLELLGLLDWKVRDWELYSINRKRLSFDMFISGLVVGTISFLFFNGILVFLSIIVFSIIVFSIIPKGKSELEDFNTYLKE